MLRLPYIKESSTVDSMPSPITKSDPNLILLQITNMLLAIGIVVYAKIEFPAEKEASTVSIIILSVIFFTLSAILILLVQWSKRLHYISDLTALISSTIYFSALTLLVSIQAEEPEFQNTLLFLFILIPNIQMLQSNNMNNLIVCLIKLAYDLLIVLLNTFLQDSTEYSPRNVFYFHLILGLLFFFLSLLRQSNCNQVLSVLRSSNNENIRNFENLIENISTKFVCLCDNQILYCNKSYREAIEKVDLNRNHLSDAYSKTENFSLRDNFISQKEDNLSSRLGMRNILSEKNNSFFQNLFKSNNNHTQNISLYETIQDLINYNTSDETLEFIKLGIHFNVQNDFKNFYEVFYRKFKHKNMTLLEMLIYEVTEVKEGEKVIAENKYKQKILSKIAHEFKTPLNNILSITHQLNEYFKEVLNGCNIDRADNLSSSKDLKEDKMIRSSICKIKNFRHPKQSEGLISPRSFSKLEEEIKNDQFFKTFLSPVRKIRNISQQNSIQLPDERSNSNLISAAEQTFFYSRLISSLANLTIYQVNDMINYANNFDFGIMKIEKGHVKIKDILNFCFDILEALVYCFADRAEKVKTDLIIDPDLENKKIMTDDLRIKQVLLNLITNAVKFTKQGYIKISAEYEKTFEITNSLEKKSVKSENIIIKIQDTGVGIKEEEKAKLNKRINEKFSSQLNDEDYMNSKGSGLGLFICKSICDRLNYDFIISETTKGSCFKIRILETTHSLEFSPKRKTNYMTEIDKLNTNINVKTRSLSRKFSQSYSISKSCNQLLMSTDIEHKKESMNKTNIIKLKNHLQLDKALSNYNKNTDKAIVLKRLDYEITERSNEDYDVLSKGNLNAKKDREDSSSCNDSLNISNPSNFTKKNKLINMDTFFRLR